MGLSRGQKISALMEAHGKTAYSLAKQTGLSTTYIEKLRADLIRKPSYDNLRKIALALGLGDASGLDPEDRETRELPGLEDLPAWVVPVLRRLGKRFDQRQWERAVAYMEGLAAERADRRAVYGYNVAEPGDDIEYRPGDQSA